MSDRRARVEKLVQIARGEDKTSTPSCQVDMELNPIESNTDYSLLLLSNTAVDLAQLTTEHSLSSSSSQPSPHHLSQHWTPNIVEGIEHNIENIAQQPYNILKTLEPNSNAWLPYLSENIAETNQYNVEDPSQFLTRESDEHNIEHSSNLSASHELSTPGPSRSIIVNNRVKNVGEDYSSGSDDIWQPPQLEVNREQSSSDIDAPLRESQSMNPDVDNSNVQSELNPVNKRKKGQGPMQRKLRKLRSECCKKGEEYVTAKGKLIPAKRPSPLDNNCRAKCQVKTHHLDLVKIYEDYRKLPTRDTQKRYLSGLIKIKPIERSKRNATRTRDITVCYTVEGAEGNICKRCFLKVFAESEAVIADIIKKKKLSPSSIILDVDKRKTREQPGNKRSEEDVAFAKDFINSFPAYESHYSRSHTTKRYLEHNLNLQTLYTLYKEKHANIRSDARPLSLSVFRNVFKSLNLKFKKPSNDTCKTCDSLSLKISSCVSDENRQQLELERSEHQNKATFHYETKRLDKDKSCNSGGKIVVAAFDLQKCLPTPNLTASVAFYKRKLWTFNLTIRNVTTKRTFHYVWHEGIAQRGADEIASCLWHFIMGLAEEVEELILYSDTCPGQNRNNILPVMFSMVLERKTSLKKIHHKFLVPGHTHLECDTDHAAIERFVKKRNSTISVPQDWVSVIKMTSNRYDVKLMNQSDFFAFSKLLTTHFIKRNTATDKTTFAWNSIFWLMYEKSNDVGFKYTLSENEDFRYFCLKRRGKSVPLSEVALPLAYDEPINIDALKFKDILDLLPFIDPIYHDFFKSLSHGQSRNNRMTFSDSDEDYE